MTPVHAPRGAASTAGNDAGERERAAVAKLEAVLTDLAAGMTRRIDERCPYRACEDRCTFAGGCMNQRREAREGVRVARCAGDHQLRRRAP